MQAERANVTANVLHPGCIDPNVGKAEIPLLRNKYVEGNSQQIIPRASQISYKFVAYNNRLSSGGGSRHERREKTCKHNEGLPRPWTQNLQTQLGFGDKTKTTWLLQDKVLTDPAVWILFTDLFFWLSSSFFKSIPQVWWWSTTPPHGVDQFLLQHANQTWDSCVMHIHSVSFFLSFSFFHAEHWSHILLLSLAFTQNYCWSLHFISWQFWQLTVWCGLPRNLRIPTERLHHQLLLGSGNQSAAKFHSSANTRCFNQAQTMLLASWYGEEAENLVQDLLL